MEHGSYWPKYSNALQGWAWGLLRSPEFNLKLKEDLNRRKQSCLHQNFPKRLDYYCQSLGMSVGILGAQAMLSCTRLGWELIQLKIMPSWNSSWGRNTSSFTNCSLQMVHTPKHFSIHSYQLGHLTYCLRHKTINSPGSWVLLHYVTGPTWFGFSTSSFVLQMYFITFNIS